jgi:hypothetical protein
MKLPPTKSTLFAGLAKTTSRLGGMSDIVASLSNPSRHEAMRSMCTTGRFIRRRSLRPSLGEGPLHNNPSPWRMVNNLGPEAVEMGISGRAFLLGGLITIITAGFAAGESPARPPVGGVGSPPDAMIFYLAHGAADACGPGCSDWIAAEGTVQFDTNRRLIAILDRQAGRKLPLVIHAWGGSNLDIATKIGRILRDRGVDATAGATDVEACHGKLEADCFALKRPGGPLDAAIKAQPTACDIACVLMLAGAVHRSLPPTTRVILTGTTIFNRLAPNVSEDEREGATAIFGQRFRVYLRDMGIDTELLDIVDRNSASRRATELPPTEWLRLGIVTTTPAMP